MPKKRINGKLLGAIVGAILVFGAVFLPLPYYLEVPGSAETLTDIVEVDGVGDDHEGAFMLTTVGIRQATLVQLAAAQFNDFTDVYSKKELFGTDTSAEYNRMQENYMTSSQNTAMQVALDLAQIDYQLNFDGVYVMSVTADSNFNGALATGDVVTAINGEQFNSSQEFMDYVKSKAVGDVVTITYQRSGKEMTAKGALIELSTDQKPGIGISLTDKTTIEPAVDIAINAGSIGGPSAGLMFTLETYSLLSKQDLRKGHLIAGTGTISSDGTVGRIGGIDKKIVAASEAGAEIFFAPDDEITAEMLKVAPDLKSNYQEAVAAGKKIKTNMKIVPVKTVQDALAYLATLEEKS